jgi:predicted RNA binding protein YcfA (HicA-like mRNA interferase family)
MGSQLKKKVEKLRRQPFDVSPDELHTILTFYGFERCRTKGSHQIYVHPLLPDLLTIPYRRPVKFIYVKKALRAIDFLEQLESE